MEATAAGLTATRGTHAGLWAVAVLALCLSGVFAALAITLAVYASSPEIQQHLANLNVEERAVVQRSYDVYFVGHVGLLALLLLTYSIAQILMARGVLSHVYMGVGLSDRLAWEANGWLWLLFVLAFSNVGVTRDWLVQVVELCLMVSLSIACFARGTGMFARESRRRVWARLIAILLATWVLAEWIGLGSTPEAIEEVQAAFRKANLDYWMTADTASVGTVLDSLPWLVVAAMYVLASSPGGQLVKYFSGDNAYPAWIARFGVWAAARARTWEPYLLLGAVVASWAANLWTLVPVWVLLLIPSLGIRDSLRANVGSTEGENTQRRDQIIVQSRWPLLLLAAVGAIIAANAVLSALPTTAQPSANALDALRENAPSAVVLAVVAFLIIVLHYGTVVFWPYHAGQCRWKEDQRLALRADLRAAESDLTAAADAPLAHVRLSAAAAAYVDVLRLQARYSVAQARVAQLREIPVWPFKSRSALLGALTRGSVLSAALSQVSAITQGGHPAQSEAGTSAATVFPEVLKVIAAMVGKTNG